MQVFNATHFALLSAEGRRVSFFTIVLAILFVIAGAVAGAYATDQESLAKPIEVDQVTDPSVDDVSLMFQFKPTLLRVNVGQKVRFLNSRGQHSVISVKRMWPEGVPHINLTNLTAADITFNKAGVYGLTCKVHGRFGMVMLIAVGEELSNLKQVRKGMPSGRAGVRMKQLMEELEKSR